MNIQIFGISKSFDTKKAQRYFSDRKIRVRYSDIKERPLSRGELESVINASGSIDAIIDKDNKDKDLVALLMYLTEDAKKEKILENQHVIIFPIVRNSRKATVGYQPDIWKNWE